MIDKEKAKKPPASSTSKVKEERRKADVKQANDSSTTRQPPQREASTEEISEFFGEAKKSSVRQLLVGDSEEDSEFEAAKEGRQSDSDESEGMETVMRETAKDAEFSLEELIQKRLRYDIIIMCMFKHCIIIPLKGLRVGRNLVASYSSPCLVHHRQVLVHPPLPLVTIATARRGRRKLTARKVQRSLRTLLLWRMKVLQDSLVANTRYM